MNCQAAPCVLCVEDDHALQNLMEFTLTEMGTRPILAPSVADGWLRFIENRSAIDLVITDGNLPDGQGSELAKKIKEICPVPVFLFSASPESTVTEDLQYFDRIFSKDDLSFREMHRAISMEIQAKSQKGLRSTA